MIPKVRHSLAGAAPHRDFQHAAVALVGALLLPWAAGGIDIRVSRAPVSVTLNGVSEQLGKGGRVGNWIAGSGSSVVLDANIFPFSLTNTYLTNIFTLSPTSGALTLISDATPGDASEWTAGDGSTGDIPQTGYYLGNPWFCPGGPSTSYILFQAQNSGSMIGVFGQPGGGYDNDIWLYRPATGTAAPKVWKLTNYGISPTGGLTTAVLGPQCSQDSSSSTNQLHIVYGHLVQNYAPSSTCNTGNGPSDGTCWWFGQWELVYGDVNFDGSGNPAIDSHCVSMSCAEPYLVQNTTLGAPYHVSPRDQACNPFCMATGTGATLNVSTKTLTLPGGTALSTAMVGSGISLPVSGSTTPFYSEITCYNGVSPNYGVSCSGTSSVTLASTPPSGTITGAFTIRNYVVYEPHWYVSNMGNLYLTSNRRPVYHDAVGLVYSFSSGSSAALQELAGGSPPYVSGGASGTGFANTFWNEFLTPDPSLTHFIFMSDRATNPAHFSLNPEYSDHYMCSAPNCSDIVRLTYYNDIGSDSTLPFGPGHCSPVSSCVPITAVRGAWSPDGTQYMTLVEYLAYSDHVGTRTGAVLYNYALTFPNTQVVGNVAVNGQVTIGH